MQVLLLLHHHTEGPLYYGFVKFSKIEIKNWSQCFKDPKKIWLEIEIC